jgi:hypothetical protein
MQQVLEAIVSVFTQTTSQHMPEYADTTEQHLESAFDQVCRTNPFLIAFAS